MFPTDASIRKLKPVVICAVLGAFSFGSVAAAATDGTVHPDLSGFWEPPSGAKKPLGQPQFTPFAIEAQKPLPPSDPESVWEANGIDAADTNCLLPAQPWTLVQSAPISIRQDDKEVIILNEKRSSPVHIYIDGRQHPDLATYRRSLNGHSIGHWEGDELVVDTIGFADHGNGHGPINDLPHTSTLHLVQRFHLANNGQELRARFTIEDPKLLKEPYVYDFSWHKLPAETNYAITEICDARDPARSHY